MAGDTANPRVWLGADVYVAPLATTAPTNVETAWAAGWDPLGLLSEDGLTEGRDESQNDHYAWGNILVRTTRSRHKRTFMVTALEDNPTVFGLVNPGSTATVTPAGAGPPIVPAAYTTRDVMAPQSDPRAFGIELVDGVHKRRIIVPRGEILTVESVASSETSMTMYGLTITVYPASDGSLFTEITSNPASVGA